LAALDADVWVVDAEGVELVGDGVVETRLEFVVGGCGGWVGCAGDDEDAQDRAVLDHLEFADLGVAAEQREVEGVDGDGVAVAGGEVEDVVAAAVDGVHPGEDAPARAGVGVEGDDVGNFEAEERLHQVVQVGDQ